TERRFEGIDGRRGDPAHRNEVRRPDQHHARDRLRARTQGRKGLGRHPARIDVARVRRDQRLGEDFGGRLDLAEQFRNRGLQPAPESRHDRRTAAARAARGPRRTPPPPPPAPFLAALSTLPPPPPPPPPPPKKKKKTPQKNSAGQKKANTAGGGGGGRLPAPS